MIRMIIRMIKQMNVLTGLLLLAKFVKVFMKCSFSQCSDSQNYYCRWN